MLMAELIRRAIDNFIDDYRRREGGHEMGAGTSKQSAIVAKPEKAKAKPAKSRPAKKAAVKTKKPATKKAAGRK